MQVQLLPDLHPLSTNRWPCNRPDTAAPVAHHQCCPLLQARPTARWGSHGSCSKQAPAHSQQAQLTPSSRHLPPPPRAMPQLFVRMPSGAVRAVDVDTASSSASELQAQLEVTAAPATFIISCCLAPAQASFCTWQAGGYAGPCGCVLPWSEVHGVTMPMCDMHDMNHDA